MALTPLERELLEALESAKWYINNEATLVKKQVNEAIQHAEQKEREK